MDNKDCLTIESDIKYHYDNEPNGVQINPFLISLKNHLNDNSVLFSKRIQWKFEIFIYFIHEFYLIESSNEYYIKIDYNKLGTGNFFGGFLKLDNDIILPILRDYKLKKIKEKIS